MSTRFDHPAGRRSSAATDTDPVADDALAMWGLTIEDLVHIIASFEATASAERRRTWRRRRKIRTPLFRPMHRKPKGRRS